MYTNLLGNIQLRQQNDETAEWLFKNCVPTYAEQLGHYHRHTLIAKSNLALTFVKLLKRRKFETKAFE